jgi:hypothetical protein
MSSSPWYFPTVEDYRMRLERHSFEVEYIELIPRPTLLPTDMRGWLETFGVPFIQHLPPAEHSSALEESVGLLRPALCDDKGRWTADYMRLRFLARVRS